MLGKQSHALRKRRIFATPYVTTRETSRLMLPLVKTSAIVSRVSHHAIRMVTPRSSSTGNR
eukprot:2688896-Lingulodinium_polyedra.AAC.1